MNRHGIVNLVILVVVLAVIAVTAAIVGGAFYAPALVRDLVGDVGYVLSIVVLFGMLAGAIFFNDRIHEWFRRRYELSDQSPDHLPER